MATFIFCPGEGQQFADAITNEFGQIIGFSPLSNTPSNGYVWDGLETHGSLVPPVVPVFTFDVDPDTGELYSGTLTSNTDPLLFVVQPTVTLTDNVPLDFIVTDCSGVEGETTITTSSSFANVYINNRIYGDETGAASYLDNVLILDKIDEFTLEIDRPLANSFTNETLHIVISRGQITGVELLNEGRGYMSLPDIVLPDHVAGTDPHVVDAKLVITSGTIGHINSFNIKDQGIFYFETPIISAPLVVSTYESPYAFTNGELLVDPNMMGNTDDPYTSDWYPLDVYGEPIYSGYYPLVFNGTSWEYDFMQGPHATLQSKDSVKNTMTLVDVSDNYNIILESGQFLIDENSDFGPNFYVHEASMLGDWWNNGGYWYGLESNATAHVSTFKRADIVAQNGAVVHNKAVFETNAGFTSDAFIRLHDGKRIQDYSYYIKTLGQLINNVEKALCLVEYKDTVGEMVHPAGFKMYGDVILTDFQSLSLTVKKKVDAFGNEVGEPLLLSFLLSFASVFNEIDFNAFADNDSNFKKFQELTLIIDKYSQLFRDVDYDTMSGKAFKYRVLEMMYRLETTLVSQPSIVGLREDIYIEKFDEAFFGLTPNELERIKFTIRPYVGMAEEVEVADSLTYDYMPGFAHTQNDLNYTGANAGYWNYPTTYVDVFKDVVFSDFATNRWTSKKNKYIVPDSYMVIAVKTP